MRTNIEIDDTLMAEALAASGGVTKREVVERALRDFVRRHRQRKALDSFGKYPWDGDLDKMRRDA